MTVVALVNGMVGGTSLVLPYMGIKTGWIMSALICSGIGLITYYTAYLIVLHLGKGAQIKDCILNHFNNDYRYMTGYSFLIWLSFMPYLLIYFRIICLQIEGIMGHHSDLIGPLVAVGLIILVILIRIYHIGEEAMAYGIVSIIVYLLFLTWAQFTAPEGPKSVPTSGDPVSLASSLITAYAIHDFLVANIIKNPNRDEFHSTVRRTFFIGTVIYAFICFGSFGRD
jgi:amino acid permease